MVSLLVTFNEFSRRGKRNSWRLHFNQISVNNGPKIRTGLIIFAAPNLQLVVIADGVGGNNGGNVAAEETVAALGRYFTQEAPKTVRTAKAWFRDKVRLVNKLILNKANSNLNYRGMGTTMVAAILIDNVAVVANIGDSRGYIFHQDLLTQITVDHSLVNELVKNGDLTEQEAAHSRKITLLPGQLESQLTLKSTSIPLNSGKMINYCCVRMA